MVEIAEDLEEDDGRYSANLHEEHHMESRGIQAPKYNETKHNRIENKVSTARILLDGSIMQSEESGQSIHSRELCIICYDNIFMKDMIKLIQPCNHYFHTNCIN